MNAPRPACTPTLRLAVALLCGAVSLSAQQLVVSESVSQVEVLLPDRGWRRAVLGRVIPSGSVITTWLDSEMMLGQPGVDLRLMSLGHLVVESMTETALELRLTAGALWVDVVDTAVRITVANRGYTITTTGARFSIDNRAIAIETGEVQVDGAYAPAPITLADGAEFSFMPRYLGSVFPVTPAQ